MKKWFKKAVSAFLSVVMTAAVLLPLAGIYGSGKVRAAEEGTPGDVNMDGTANNKDVAALFRRVNGSSDPVDEIACDTNGDGLVNNKDVVTLFRYVSGGDEMIFYGVPHTDDPNNIFRTWTSPTLKAFTSTKQTAVTVADGEVTLAYEKSGVVKDPYAVLDISKYVKLTGRDPLAGREGSFIVFKMKSTGDGYMEIFTGESAEGTSGTVSYIPDGEWHWAVVDMTASGITSSETLSALRIDWTGGSVADGGKATISEIGFFATMEEVCEYTGLAVDELDGKNVGSLIVPETDASKYYSISGSEPETVTIDGKTAIKITSGSKNARISVDVSSLAALEGGITHRAHYLAAGFKISGMSKAAVALYSVTDTSGATVTTSHSAKLDVGDDGWQGVMFDLRALRLKENAIKKIMFEISGFTEDSVLYYGGAIVTPSVNDALAACGRSEYLLNYDDELSDNDPLAHATLTAENEDPGFRLWFDHSTEKSPQNVLYGSRSGYTVRMAKNEMENCNFYVVPYKDMTVRVEVDPFTDGENTLPHELMFMCYHNIESVIRPDAIPAYYEPVAVTANKSQGFVLQFTTTADTPAGTYESVVHIYDDETGEEIKRAPVAVKVWDFELSEETELRTSFAIWNQYIINGYNWDRVDFSDAEVLDNYFEFFLKYRINIMDTWRGLNSDYADNYMRQKRVNTIRWTNLDTSLTEACGGTTPPWAHKVIYYPTDEPASSAALAQLVSNANRIRLNTPDYRLVCPFACNIDLADDGSTADFEESTQDQVAFMSQAVNIWCPLLNAFTSRKMSFISQVSFLQSEDQDERYGTFVDRMKAEVAEGDDLWAYICVSPMAPYVNWQINNDGTEAVISAWQMKQLGVTGMLYWAVDYWKVNYWDTYSPWPSGVYGDGMLIYSGYRFNSPYPVSTLRLESIRDGIEDYQMLSMLEQACGKEAADEMISRLTTTVVTYTDNDDYVHAVRVLLGDTLERVLAD